METIAKRPINLIRKLAWGYAALFLGVVVVGYLPGLTNADGQLLGLFMLEPLDDMVHLISAVWAAAAAWTSTRASVLYFKIFGVIYGLDGVLGLLFGQGILDGGIVRFGVTPLDLTTRVGANLPHIVIGGLAIWIGFFLSRRYPDA